MLKKVKLSYSIEGIREEGPLLGRKKTHYWMGEVEPRESLLSTVE